MLFYELDQQIITKYWSIKITEIMMEKFLSLGETLKKKPLPR